MRQRFVPCASAPHLWFSLRPFAATSPYTYRPASRLTALGLRQDQPKTSIIIELPLRCTGDVAASRVNLVHAGRTATRVGCRAAGRQAPKPVVEIHRSTAYRLLKQICACLATDFRGSWTCNTWSGSKWVGTIDGLGILKPAHSRTSARDTSLSTAVPGQAFSNSSLYKLCLFNGCYP